ncbi:hypothetical protein CHM34_06335 [Paludifilum halophilum]|uniref:Uncharacterized protein n=1 Tax=Paludifilum halophilum TaxID=1642702 RepID=A0A235B838_9BACL|nr:hypothetical protein CHM34_06335 [Paludifilum halophilum]
MGFHTPFRCSDEPKALRVEPHPPENGLFHNASSAPSGNQVGRVVGRRRSFALRGAQVLPRSLRSPVSLCVFCKRSVTAYQPDHPQQGIKQIKVA